MLGVGLWGGAKGNSHMGKGHRARASVYFGHMSCFFFFFFFLVCILGLLLKLDSSLGGFFEVSLLALVSNWKFT